MNTPTETTAAAIRPTRLTSKSNTSISKDGKWKSWPKLRLMQYVPSGIYFARVKVGKVVKRASLETDVFTTATNKLPDKIKDLKAPAPEVGTFGEARALYEADLAADHTLADASKRYRRTRIAALLKSWPRLDGKRLDKITLPECRVWAKTFAEDFDEQNFNNTLGTLRGVLQRGGLKHDANPAMQIKRLGVKPTELQLPEPEQFTALLVEMRSVKSRFTEDATDLAEFLAYSGCRKSESRIRWKDCLFDRGEIKVRNAKRSKKSSQAEFRYIPMIPPMRDLLERLWVKNPKGPNDFVSIVTECEKSLTRACKKIGITRLTHHDLRHLFATRCIEAGVDIPTVSRWLGHVDGGGLAMRTYGHLRREHSQQMAKKVTFGVATSPENVTSLPNLANA